MSLPYETPASTAASTQSQKSQQSPHGQQGPQNARNPIGRISLIIAIATQIGSLIWFAAQQFIVVAGTLEPSSFSAMLVARSVIVGVLSLAAVVTGGIGLAIPRRPRVAAAVGLALGASMLLTIVVGAIVAPIAASVASI